MQKSYKYIIAITLLTAATAIFQSCGGKGDADDKSISVKKDTYTIPDSLLKTLNIDTVSTEQLKNAITLTGKVSFNEDNVAKIYPMVSGTVTDIRSVLGDYVNAGQVLGVIHSSEMAGYSNDLINAETNLRVAKKNLDATKDMATSGLASQKDVLGAEAAYEQAQSELNRVNRVLKINGGNTQGDFLIKSPVSGFIVEKQATNNMVIRTDNNNDLFTISDLKNVWIWANVYESNIGNVHVGDDVDVTTLSYPGRVFKGKIDKIMNVLDPTNKVMKVRVVLSNTDYALKPEMFASVTVSNKENKTALSIPSQALIFDNSQYFVVVYNSKSDVQIRPVKIINIVGQRAYITEGLKEGDKIIGSQAILIYGALNS